METKQKRFKVILNLYQNEKGLIDKSNEEVEDE